MNNVLKIVVGVFLVAAVAAGSFYGGLLYGENQAQAAFATPEDAAGQWAAAGEGRPGMPGQRGAGSGQGGMLSGEILVIDNGELTIEDASGRRITVHVTDTALIQKQADVTVADLQEGETVIVSGSQESDGSITARMVQVSSLGNLGMPGNLPFDGQPEAPSGGTTP